MWFRFICSVPFPCSFMAEGARSEVCSQFGYVAPKASTLWGWSDTDTITILDVPKMLLRTEGPSGEFSVFKPLFCAFCSIRTVLTEGFGYEIALCFYGITLSGQLSSTSLSLPAVCSQSTDHLGPSFINTLGCAGKQKSSLPGLETTEICLFSPGKSQ